jgi:hypothetical protein
MSTSCSSSLSLSLSHSLSHTHPISLSHLLLDLHRGAVGGHGRGRSRVVERPDLEIRADEFLGA